MNTGTRIIRSLRYRTITAISRCLPPPTPAISTSLATRSSATSSNPSARRVNRLFDGMPTADRYLEVGLSHGFTFEQVSARHRVGVDPRPKFSARRLPVGVTVNACTSDTFFAEASDDLRFDIVFLDGLHTFAQTYRDLINAFKVCPDGVILIDDVVPSNRFAALPDEDESRFQRSQAGIDDEMWQGDVFKVIECLHIHHPQVEVRTIVDDGNPQALVWLSGAGSRHEPIVPVTPDEFEEINRLTFGDVFTNGHPASFAPCTETEAIGAALAAVGPRFGSTEASVESR